MKNLITASVVLSALCWSLFNHCAAQGQGKMLRIQTREVSLGKVNPGFISEVTPVVSDDGKHLAYLAEEGGQEFVIVDGVPGKRYGTIEGPLRFNHDGSRLAYVAQRAAIPSAEQATASAFLVHSDGYLLTSAHVVERVTKIEVQIGGRTYSAALRELDKIRDVALLKIEAKDLPALPLGESGKAQSGADIRAFGFPHGSETVRVTRGSISGTRRKPYSKDKVFEVDAAVNPGNSGGPIVNERGEVLGIITMKSNEEVPAGLGFAVPIDHARPMLARLNVPMTTQPPGPSLSGVALTGRVSPAIGKVTVIHKTPVNQAGEGVRQVIVVNGAESKEYDAVFGNSIVFSPDGKRLSYVVTRGSAMFRVLDGVESQPYDGASEDAAFSPNSKRLAYTVMRGKKWALVVDGKEGKRFEDIGEGSPLFSPDSKRILYAGQRGSQWVLMVDGVETRTYDGLVDFAFSPNSKRVAYAAMRGAQQFVVADGLEAKAYDGAMGIQFSPDSRRMAYLALRDGKWMVVIDGKEGKGYQRIYPILLFSADSRRLAYVVMSEENIFVVVDGTEEKNYDFLLPPLVFDGTNLLRALAFRDEEFFRVEMELVEQ